MQQVSDMTTVDDPTLLRTMFYLWERLKLVVEPTGALGAAAVMWRTASDLPPISGSRIGVVLSGGNVDLSQISQWLAAI
jgi:threonine dehydratase